MPSVSSSTVLALACGHFTFDTALALFQPATVPAQIVGDLQSADLGIDHPALAGIGLGVGCDMVIAQTPDFITSDRQFLRQRFAIVRHAEFLPFRTDQFLCRGSEQTIFK